MPFSKKIRNKLALREAQPVAVDTEDGFSENSDFISLSSKFKVAKFITLAVLIFFILSMITLFRSEITVENFRYLARNFDTSGSGYTGSHTSVYYDVNGERSVSLYRNDIAVVTQNSVNLYNTLGNNVLSSAESYLTPTVVSGGKYLLVYDLGGTGYSVYNNFSKLSSGAMDYQIRDAATSSGGTFAIVTKATEYQSAVYVYDTDFNNISRIYKDKYVVDVQVNSNKNEVLLLSEYVEDGDFSAEIMICSPDSSSAVASYTITGALPVSAKYADNGSFSVLCDNGLYFFDYDCNLVNTYSFNGEIPTECYCWGSNVLLAFNQNIVGYDSYLTVFNTAGVVMGTAEISEQIFDIEAYGKSVFVLHDDYVDTFTVGDSKIKTMSVNKNPLRLMVIDENTLLVAYTNNTDIYNVSDSIGE